MLNILYSTDNFSLFDVEVSKNMKNGGNRIIKMHNKQV